LIDYYRQNGRLVEVKGDLPVKEVFDGLCAVIDGYKKEAV